MEPLVLIAAMWAEPTVKQWLDDHPGDGPLDKQELTEGAWLAIQYWKTSRAFEWYTELVSGTPSMN